MKRTIGLPVIAALFLLTLWPAPTLGQWNMGKTIKDLLTKRAEAKEEKKNAQNPKKTPTRFKDNGNGTLTDSATGLIWLKDANCAVFFKEDSSAKNSRNWTEARVAANRLAHGFCGLSDRSKQGEWRLPDREELLTVANDITGKEKWLANEAFTGIQPFYYWSSTKGDLYPDYAFYVSMVHGVDSYAFQLNSFHVLPVKSKQKPK